MQGHSGALSPALGAGDIAEGERARYGEVAASKAADLLRRLAVRPLFAQFERCLRLFLAGNPDPSTNRAANLLERMPHTLAQEVGHNKQWLQPKAHAWMGPTRLGA